VRDRSPAGHLSILNHAQLRMANFLGHAFGQGDSESNEGLTKKGGCDLFRAHGLLSPGGSFYQVALKELPPSLIIGRFDQLQKGRN